MKRSFTFLLFFLSFFTSLHAQKQGRELIDSLLARVPFGENDTNKVLLLCKLSDLYAYSSSDTGMIYGQRAINLAKEIDWRQGMAIAKIAIGGNYLAKTDHAKALACYFEALKIGEDLGSKSDIAISLGDIGNVYYRQKNYDKAFEYYEKAYKMFAALGAKEKMATNLGNMGNIYSHYFDTAKINLDVRAANRAKTLTYYEQAYQIYKEIGNKNGMARNMGNAGNIYVRDDDETRALEQYTGALKMYEEIGNKTAQAAFLINISSIYKTIAEDSTGKKRVNNYTHADKKVLVDRAIAIILPSIQLASEAGFLEALQSSYNNLAALYAMKGDYKRAFEMDRKYADMLDSIYKQNNGEEISKLEAQYKLDQQDKEIHIKQLEVAKKRNTNLFLGGGMGLLFVVILFILKQRKKSEQLLLNILPGKIAERLKRKEHPIADQFSSASVMFIDMADFTHFSADRDPKELVTMLNEIFTLFDVIAEKHGLEKIKTIGDCYMAVSGLPQPRRDHAIAAANMALDVKEQVKNYKTKDGTPVRFRIGLDCGPVVAGVIGSKKFIYDLWGDPVNTASRMESTGVVGEIHCTEHFMHAVHNRSAEDQKYNFVTRGTVEIKGKGKMQTYLLQGVEMPEIIVLN